MSFSKEGAVTAAKKDLAKRLKIDNGQIKEVSVTDKEFPDMSFGAPVDDEMSAQMITSGWQIKLGAGGKNYEYRTDKYQMRLVNFNGRNFIVE